MRDKPKGVKEKRAGKIDVSANTRAIWSVIVLMIVLEAIGLHTQGMTLVPRALLANVTTVAVIAGIAFIYTRLRPSPRIAEMAHMMAVILAFTCTAAIGSYIVVTFHRPLIDGALVAADRAMGLHWVPLHKWVMAHKYLKRAFLVAYSSLIPQLLFLIILFDFKGLCARGWEVIWLLMISCILCIIISGIWPAAGAFGYYHIDFNNPYVQVFLGLHNGTIKTIGDKPIQGVIQFPSFHVALAIVLTYAARGRKILFITFLEINTILFLSTPSIGGHHFADLWGGVVLALVTIWCVRAVLSPRLMPDMEKITPM